MTEPWFDANIYGWIPGTLLGVIGGGIGGPLIGICAGRGKLKGLVLGFVFTILATCAILLGAGLYALVSGQPYGVWYGLGFAGLLGLIIFGGLTPIILSRYREAELRKSLAEDLMAP
ncbi:MAG: hypothetical protein N839_0002375 [Desulfofustis sp. PB-SRB1]|mgnify:CR=1 FL=1|jgi:hypothetical protein|nr:hypothetical protein [Desulfofustis sp. PB-SRB1]MBM1001237.1 hypothetical protein [Desulfofustis sp. PB-SRB1]HBH28621.1 hypothetical protein [Desulfofustis sp.]HBH32206.1 hypothetical protein [Desulfofustis sp.]